MTNDTVLIGVGNGGCKILSKVNNEAEKVFLNTDRQNVETYSGLCIGTKTCGGLSTAGSVATGELAAIESKSEILEKIDRFSNWVVICTLGGGTGCGVSRKLVDFARENNKSVTVITSIPFGWEGEFRLRRALDTLIYLNHLCKVVEVKLDFQKQNKKVSFAEACSFIDEKFLTEIDKIINK